MGVLKFVPASISRIDNWLSPLAVLSGWEQDGRGKLCSPLLQEKEARLKGNRF